MKRQSFLAASAAAALLPARAGAQSPALLPVTIATIQLGTGMQPHFAEAQGFFTKAGLNATVETLANGSAITAAVVAGSIDIGFSNLLSVAQAYEQNLPLVVLFPAGLAVAETPDGGLMVNKDSGITSARDLNGKTIGIPGIGNMTQLGPMAWIDQHGGDSKTIHWVEIPFPTLAPALDQHRVDAAFVAEPFFTPAKKNNRVLGYILEAISPRFASGAWFSTKSWANAHPEVVSRFIGVMAETARWVKAHRRETVPLIAKYLKVPEAIVTRQPPGTYAEALVSSEFQPLLDSAAKYGLLKKRLTVDDLAYRPPK